MKLRLSLALAALAFAFLPSCESIPITASYTGAFGGHEYTAGYSKAGGAVLVVHQK